MDENNLKELLAEAVRQPTGPERDSWIKEACKGDSVLESKLRDVLNTSQATFDLSGGELSPEPTANDETPSDHIGVFRIGSEIGRGGMGVVYRATDTRLDRTVAIKALPANMGSDPQRMARFEREAKTLASLNHPNIAAIYGLEEQAGRNYLVLEYVDGDTLADQLVKGRLPVDEAMTICAKIAAGVAAAHDAGIIHRDLKPANIKITSNGDVKVLDFGLAKAAANSAAKNQIQGQDDDDLDFVSDPDMQTLDRDRSDTFPDADTRTLGQGELSSRPPSSASPFQTMEGAIIGTAAYMSPEQARGRKIDHRTDVWSFGVILHECLTGASYFRTGSALDSIDAILNKAITYENLPEETSPLVRHVLERCLERDRSKRIRDMHDVRLALEHDHSSADLSALAAAASRRLPIGRLATAALLLAVGILTIGFFSGRSSVPIPPEPARPLTHVFAPAYFDAEHTELDLSTDGSLVAYRGKDGQPDGPFAIYLRELGAVEARRLPFTDHVSYFSLSPDGSKIAFFWDDPSSNRIELRVIDVSGGKPTTLFSDSEHNRFPAGVIPPTWLSATELAVVSNAKNRPPVVYRVPINLSAGLNNDYELEILAELEPGDGIRHAYDLTVVPGQDYLVFTLGDNTTQSWKWSTHRLDADGIHLIVKNANQPRVTSDGRLIFRRGFKIHAAKFDLQSGTLLGEPVSLYPDLQGLNYDYADNGTLVIARRFGNDAERRVVAIQRNGERTVLSATPANFVGICAVSPQGDKIVVQVEESRIANSLAVLDVATGKMQPVPPPPDGASMSTASWLPDGRICFSTWEGPGDHQIYVVDKALTKAKLLFGGPDPIGTIHAPQWTADGQQAIFDYWRGPRSGYGIYTAELEGTFEPKPLVVGENIPGVPRISPDGRWLAYQELFPSYQVYVQPLSLDSDQRENRLVIPNGRGPRWAPDGTELFYLHSETTEVMAVRVSSDPALAVSEPRKIMATSFEGIEILPDGRFVYVAEPEGGYDPHLHFMLNMDQEIERRFQEQAVQRP